MRKIVIVLMAIIVVSGIQAQTGNTGAVNQLIIVANHPGPVISKDIYGHFSEHLGTCIYGGLWVGTDSKIPNTYGIRNDVLFALREIKIPNLRWPGGCFADVYHWRDGVGEERPRGMSNPYWGRLGRWVGRVGCRATPVSRGTNLMV